MLRTTVLPAAKVASKYITPHVGERGQKRIAFWESTEKGPAFVRVLAQESGDEGACSNCAGYAAILISFCKYGPSPAPLTNKKPSTYFPGDGRFGKGWYLIEQTLALPCPDCAKATR